MPIIIAPESISELTLICFTVETKSLLPLLACSTFKTEAVAINQLNVAYYYFKDDQSQ